MLPAVLAHRGNRTGDMYIEQAVPQYKLVRQNVMSDYAYKKAKFEGTPADPFWRWLRRHNNRKSRPAGAWRGRLFFGANAHAYWNERRALDIHIYGYENGTKRWLAFRDKAYRDAASIP